MPGAARTEHEADAALPQGAPRRGSGKALPLFLHRDTYRRRRVMDAARLLPAFGAALLLLPVLWDDSHTTAAGAVYLFAAWACLILCAAILARRLSAPLRQRTQPAARNGADRPAEADADPGPARGTERGAGETGAAGA